jgi:hypothetical protein
VGERSFSAERSDRLADAVDALTNADVRWPNRAEIVLTHASYLGKMLGSTDATRIGGRGVGQNLGVDDTPADPCTGGTAGRLSAEQYGELAKPAD